MAFLKVAVPIFTAREEHENITLFLYNVKPHISIQMSVEIH